MLTSKRISEDSMESRRFIQHQTNRGWSMNLFNSILNGVWLKRVFLPASLAPSACWSQREMRSWLCLSLLTSISFSSKCRLCLDILIFLFCRDLFLIPAPPVTQSGVCCHAFIQCALSRKYISGTNSPHSDNYPQYLMNNCWKNNVSFHVPVIKNFYIPCE